MPPRARICATWAGTSARTLCHSGLTIWKGTNPQSPGVTSATARTVQVTPSGPVVAWIVNAASVANCCPSETRRSAGACPGL